MLFAKTFDKLCLLNGQNNGQLSRLRLEAKRYRIIVILVLVFLCSKLPSIFSFLLFYIVKLKLTDQRYLFLLGSKDFLLVEGIPNFKEILSLHILQEMRHSEWVTPIGGLVYMCQHVLWVILRYFSSSIKNKVKITKKQGYRKRKVK